MFSLVEVLNRDSVGPYAPSQQQQQPSFERILAGGNPWRRKHLRRRLAKQAAPAMTVPAWVCLECFELMPSDLESPNACLYEITSRLPTCGALSACSFGGTTMLEEGRASRQVEVDEHGIARRVSDDIWSESNATSRCS